jgi:hypothetical protein
MKSAETGRSGAKGGTPATTKLGNDRAELGADIGTALQSGTHQTGTNEVRDATLD